MRRTHLATLILAAALFGGCGSTSTKNGTIGANSATNLATTNSATNGSDNSATRVYSGPSELEMLFTDLSFQEALVPLNSMVSSALEGPPEDGALILLMELSDIDLEAPPMELTPMLFALRPGEFVSADRYRWRNSGQPGNAGFRAGTSEFEAFAGLELRFPVGSDGTVEGVTLWIIDVSVKGTVTSVDPPRAEGVVEGWMRQSDAEQALIRVTPDSESTLLSDLLGAENMDYDSTVGRVDPGSPGAEGWFVRATFATTGTTIDD